MVKNVQLKRFKYFLLFLVFFELFNKLFKHFMQFKQFEQFEQFANANEKEINGLIFALKMWKCCMPGKLWKIIGN